AQPPDRDGVGAAGREHQAQFRLADRRDVAADRRIARDTALKERLAGWSKHDLAGEVDVAGRAGPAVSVRVGEDIAEYSDHQRAPRSHAEQVADRELDGARRGWGKSDRDRGTVHRDHMSDHGAGAGRNLRVRTLRIRTLRGRTWRIGT